MQGGQPSAHCFFEVVNMVKQGMLFDFRNMVFQNIWLENTNEKPLSTKPVIAQIKIFCKKRYKFVQLQNFVPRLVDIIGHVIVRHVIICFVL